MDKRHFEVRAFRPLNWMPRLVLGSLVLVAAACSPNVGDGVPTRSATPRSAGQTHLQELQQIADTHGGNRAAGTAGYFATIEYVNDTLARIGWQVQRQTFTFPRYRELAPARLVVGKQSLPANTLDYSASGSVLGRVEVDPALRSPIVDGVEPSYGCKSSDITPSTSDGILVVLRGGCKVLEKAQQAAKAGYKALVLVGRPEDGPLTGTVAAPAPVPIVGVAYDALGPLRHAYDTQGNVSVSTSTELEPNASGVNLIATLPDAGSGPTVLLTGQLDSVPTGPGINDAGSGLSGILDTAAAITRDSAKHRNSLTIVLFGAEEPWADDGAGGVGLLGAHRYAKSLTPDARSQIIANLNVQMLASPNFGRFVIDGDNSDTEFKAPEGSAFIEELFQKHFEKDNIKTAPMPLWPGATYGPLADLGIPTGGLFTGDDGEKSAAEAARSGGTAAQPYDPCYHQACDSAAQANTVVLAEMTSALEDVTTQMLDVRSDPEAQTTPVPTGTQGNG